MILLIQILNTQKSQNILNKRNTNKFRNITKYCKNSKAKS